MNWRLFLAGGEGVEISSPLGKFERRDIYNFDEVPWCLGSLFGHVMNHTKGSNQNIVRWLESTVNTTKRFATFIPIVRADGYADRGGCNQIPPFAILKGTKNILYSQR